MKPKFVLYECEECGKLFYREVKDVLIDDAEHCEVLVKLANDANGELEEFPMCGCLGGDPAYMIGDGLEDPKEEE